MKLDQIKFEGCCGGHGYVEVQAPCGWLAITKRHEDGALKVRRFDAAKMPLGEWEEMTAEQVEALL